MGDVTLSQPPGMTGAPTARMQQLEAVVPVWPLLSRQVTVERLVLQRPVIELRIDAQGRRSWDFAAADDAPGPPRRIRLAQAGGIGAGKFAPPELREFLRQSSPQSREAQGSQPRRVPVDEIALGDVRVIDGAITYIDERTGVTEQITALDLQLALPAMAGPLDGLARPAAGHWCLARALLRSSDAALTAQN